MPNAVGHTSDKEGDDNQVLRERDRNNAQKLF